MVIISERFYKNFDSMFWTTGFNHDFFATIIFLRNKFYAWKRPEKKQIEISKKEIILYSIIYFITLILDVLFLRWRQL